MKYSIVLLAVLIVGCKKSDDKVISDTLTQVQAGVYQSCEKIETISAKTNVYVTDSYVQEGTVFFAGTSCASGNEMYEIKTIYSYQALGSNNYTMRIESAALTPLASAAETEFEGINFCQIASWTLNQPANILERDCEGVTFEHGNEFNMSMGMSGSSLLITGNGEKFRYSSLNAMNFANTQSLQNGNYVFYDGSVGMYFTASSPNYSVTFYDSDTRKYFMINGTYTTAGNSGTFTVNASACPSYTVGETFTMSFAQLTASLGIRESGEADLLLSKVGFTTGQFVSAFLNNPIDPIYTMGCF